MAGSHLTHLTHSLADRKQSKCISLFNICLFPVFPFLSFFLRPIIQAGGQDQAAAAWLQGTEGWCGVWGQHSEGTSLISTSPTTIHPCTAGLLPLNGTLPERSAAARGFWHSPRPITLLQIQLRPPPTCPLPLLQCQPKLHLLLQPSAQASVQWPLTTPRFSLRHPGSQRECPPLLSL